MNKKNETATRFSAAKVIFDTIVENLEKENIIWAKPWINSELPHNAVSKRPYGGFNAFLLNFITIDKGYKTSRFVTFKQAKEMGGSVRKGEKGYMIVFNEMRFAYAKDENGNVVKDENGKTKYDLTKKYFLSRYYIVFNIDQCENLPEKLYNVESFNTEIAPNAEAVLNNYEDCPPISYGGDMAAYSPSMDIIKMPYMEHFKTTEGYYSTLFHECIHSTGAKCRLNRPMSSKKENIEEYAKEELIAEIGAAILMNASGLNVEIEDKAAYCKSWLKAIKEMKDGTLMGAFTKAWKAAEYVQGRTAENKGTEEDAA